MKQLDEEPFCVRFLLPLLVPMQAFPQVLLLFQPVAFRNIHK